MLTSFQSHSKLLQHTLCFLSFKEFKYHFFKHVSYLIYDIPEQSVPTDILRQFTKTSMIHNYNARSSSNECFYVKDSKTEPRKKSFASIGVSIWNSIPYSVKSLSKYKFRNKIKQTLLETLERENDNIEVSQLINYFIFSKLP